MKNAGTSPEEKLFRIIQQDKGVAVAGKLPRRKNMLSAWKENIVPVVRALAKKAGTILPGRPNELKLENVNLGLWALLLFLVLAVAYYSVTKYPSVAKMVNAASKTQASLRPVYTDVKKLEPVNFYADAVNQRNIFADGQRQAAVSVSTELTQTVKGYAGDLKLQGISLSDVPKAIVQFEGDDKVYVLKEGQEVGSAGIKVKTILRNKVIFSQGDRDFEL